MKTIFNFLMKTFWLFLLSVVLTGQITAQDTEWSKYLVRENLTTQQLIEEMGLGINLGNTLESCGDWINKSNILNFEKAWGSPEITEKIIAGYAKAGFSSLRIPVAWSNMMQANYTIHPTLLNRVEQIVNWTIDNGMVAMINMHWDGGWWENYPENIEETEKKFTRIWQQVSGHFEKYGDRLLFEPMNEVGFGQIWDEWMSGTAAQKKAAKTKAFGYVNNLNQMFVDIVRASGGNNAKRHLVIEVYNTNDAYAYDPDFKMPNDPAKRSAATVHYYKPACFAIAAGPTDWCPNGQAVTTWGTAAELKELKDNMDKLKKNCVDKGIPIIVGEYGTGGGNKTKEMVRLYVVSITEAAYSRGMCPMIWDTPGDQYNRTNQTWRDPLFLEEMMNVKKNYAKNNDATLSALTVNPGTLTPAFAPAITSYTVDVTDVTSIEIQATANHPAASVAGAGVKSLVVGENSFDITVTAENGDKKVYNLKIAAVFNVVPPKVKFNHANLSLKPEETANLEMLANGVAVTATNWQSSNPTAATVSGTGLITAVALGGNTEITAETEIGGSIYTAKCVVYVEPQAIVIEETDPVTNGTGTTELTLEIPASILFTGSFEVELPAGVSINIDATQLAGAWSGSINMTIVPLSDGVWKFIFTLSEAAQQSKMRKIAANTNKIVDIVYNVDDSVTKDFELIIKDLSFTLQDEDGTVIERTETVVPVTVNNVTGNFIIETSNSIKIYPNPVKDELIIENGKWKIENAEIFDISGRKIVNCQFSIFNSINVSHLSSGIYILKIGEYRGRFVKE